MVETIGNPLSWGARVLGGAGQRMGDVVEHARDVSKSRAASGSGRVTRSRVEPRRSDA